jgi:hypothetical protein
MVKGPLVPNVSEDLWYQKSLVRIGALILFAFGAIYVGFELSRHDQTQNVASSKSEPVKPKERNTRPADMGIFSGRLSAKLFNSKPKRVAKRPLN